MTRSQARNEIEGRELKGRQGQGHAGATASHNSVIDAWARSKDPDKGFRAGALVEAMIERSEAGDRHLEPDVHAFTTLIKACVCSSRSTIQNQSEEVLAIAIPAMAATMRYDIMRAFIVSMGGMMYLSLDSVKY